ncbi:hypothetical protein D3C72_2115080 [compost metagenome]
MKVLAPGRHAQGLVELIHQPGFAPPHWPPEIDTADRRQALVQVFVALLQYPDRMFLCRIRDKVVFRERVLVGTEGRIEGHGGPFRQSKAPSMARPSAQPGNHSHTQARE